MARREDEAVKAYVVESTAAGTAAIAVLEVVGPDCETTVARAFYEVRLQPDTLERRTLVDGQDTIDDVVVRLRGADETMTGWPHVEIQCHGSPAVVKRIRKALVAVGAVPAPQSFLLRTAVRNGKMTRLEEEAWLCAMNALTDRAANELFEQRTKLPICASRIGETRDRRMIGDLVETAGYGVVLTHPRRVAIIGPANTGKSTLVNALAGWDRVLVDARPGTTRDVVEVPMSIRGFPFVLFDTAGLRDGGDAVEREGMARALRLASRVDLCLYCVEHNRPSRPPRGVSAIPLWTKCDIRDVTPPEWAGARVSARTGEGMEWLRETLMRRLVSIYPEGPGGAFLFTQRQWRRAMELLKCPDSEWQARWERWVYGRPRGQ